jgi:hypothetical protein
LPATTASISLVPSPGSTETFVTDETPTTILSCSQTLKQPTGFIISPGYPDYYPNNVNCTWTISLEMSHQIILTFNDFALDQHDVFSVYDNSLENGSVLFSRTEQCAVNATGFCPQNDFYSFIAKSFSLHFGSSRLFGTSRGFNITYIIQPIGTECFNVSCPLGAYCVADSVFKKFCVCPFVGPCQSDLGDVRLVGGDTSMEGRVEVFLNGKWGTVCNDSWGLDEALVVCRQLGYHFALATKGSSFNGVSDLSIVMTEVACSGNESSLQDCHFDLHTQNCSHSEDAAVRCGVQNCQSSPCQNGATCIDVHYSFSCLCPSGYAGLLCSKGVVQSIKEDLRWFKMSIVLSFE